MLLTTYQNAHDFLARTQADLLKNEAANSLMLGICFNLRDHPERFKTASYLVTVEDEQGLICAALMTPPHKLILHSQRDDHQAALKLLIENLRKLPIPGVLAPQQIAQDFAQTWRAVTGRGYKIGMRERVFELTDVQHPAPVEGALRKATENDLELITSWQKAFIEEAMTDDNAADARRFATVKIASGDMFVWELDDGKIVSMAAKTRPVIHVISIGPVYTPPEYRGKGYASNCVAALSQLLLDSGWRACSLFANLANPTSNSIYEEMGYRPLAEYHDYAFVG